MKKCKDLLVSLCVPALLLSGSITSYMAISGNSLADEPPAGASQIGIPTPTGKFITPTAARGALFEELNPRLEGAPHHRPGQAAAIALSPDGRLLAVLTSGFNLSFDGNGQSSPKASGEFVFLFDISGYRPKQIQVMTLSDTFQGLDWAPISNRLFVSGGRADRVVEFMRQGSAFVEGRSFGLGHKTCLGPPDPETCGPEAGGLAVSPDGKRLLVTNIQNDSVSLIDLATGKVIIEQDLRPGIISHREHGRPGGSYPRGVVWTSSNHAYVASARDREVITLNTSHNKIRVVQRIPIGGQPAALLTNRSRSRVFVALDTTNRVAILDSVHGKLLESFDVVAPENVYANVKELGGANSNALALTPDGGTLLVSNGGEDAIAVVRLSDRAAGLEALTDRRHALSAEDDKEKGRQLDGSKVVALVPTGWYPTGVVTSTDGTTWYIINGKSPSSANDGGCSEPNNDYCNQRADARPVGTLKYNGILDSLTVRNVFVSQLEHAGLLTLPKPDGPEFARLTKQVATNNHFDAAQMAPAEVQLFAFLRAHIKHVIYIIKENRTYDQVLGDLELGNGDQSLTWFPEQITPNHHAIARQFVTLDNFLVSGETSMTGWDWSTAAQTTDLKDRMEPITLASGFKDERPAFPGNSDRAIITGFATSKARNDLDPATTADPDILPGARFVYAPDGPGGEEGRGYIWDAALRRGLSVRNWGFYGLELPAATRLLRDPHAAHQRIFSPKIPALAPYSDIYAYTWASVPDYWRVAEWKREFTEFEKVNVAPSLMLLQLPGDHFGSFDKEIDGVNTPDTQMADNDYALGLVTETVVTVRLQITR